MEVNKTDIIRFLTKIRVNFENAYKCNTREENILLVESWYDILKKYPLEVCERAVNEALEHATQGKAPRIGDIVGYIKKMMTAYEKDDAELWAELQGVLREVSKCVYMFNYTFVEDDGVSQGDKARRRVDDIFNSLDPALKDYCRDKRGLIELANYTSEQTSYERGRFMRVMPTVRERLKTRQETPENVRLLLHGLTEKMTLIEGGNAPNSNNNETEETK